MRLTRKLVLLRWRVCSGRILARRLPSSANRRSALAGQVEERGANDRRRRPDPLFPEPEQAVQFHTPAAAATENQPLKAGLPRTAGENNHHPNQRFNFQTAARFCPGLTYLCDILPLSLMVYEGQALK